MATAAVLHPVAEVSQTKEHLTMHSQRPFDPALLIEKLEAHKYNVEMQRLTRNPRSSVSNNTAGFDTRPSGRPIVARRTSLPKSGPSNSKFRKPPSKPVQSELKRGKQPSRLQAAQCIMLPSSLTAPATNLPARPIDWNVPDPFNHLNASSAPPRRGSHDSRMPSQPTPIVQLPPGLRRGSHDSHMQQQQIHPSPRGYRPGDAEKRRFVDSLFITPGTTAAAPSSAGRKAHTTTLYSVQEIPAHRAQRDNPYGLLSPVAPRSADGAATTAIAARPKLAPHDRHDWTQQSQNAENFRVHFSLLYRSRKEQSAPATAATDTTAAAAMKRERQQSAVELPATLINDAVKLIKQEEKLKRRNSIVGFFRRFEI